MLDPLPFEAPVKPPVTATVQVYVAPAISLCRPMDVLLPEQIAEALTTGVMVGLGFTVIVAVFFVPTQPAGDVGVTSYTTVPAVVAVAVNACAIGVPVPGVEDPLTLVTVVVVQP